MPYKDRDANREKINAYQREFARQWRKKNIDLARKKGREYQAKRRLSGVDYQRLKNNPVRWAKMLAASNAHYYKNKEKINFRDTKEGIDLESNRYLTRIFLHYGVRAAILKRNPELIEAKLISLKIKRSIYAD